MVKQEVWRFFLVVSLAILIGFAFVVMANTYAQNFRYIGNNYQHLNIITTREETISLHINVGRSINGLWASEQGLRLTLTHGGSFFVVPPKGENWGDSITTSKDREQSPTVVIGNFMLPSSVVELQQHEFDGVISGDVTFPISMGYYLSSSGAKVNIPVHLEVKERNSAPWLRDEITFYAVALAGCLLFIGLPWLLRFYDARFGSRPFFDPQDKNFVASGKSNELIVTVSVVVIPVALFYGGGLVLAMILAMYDISGFARSEIFSWTVALILVVLGTLITTAIIKAAYAKKILSGKLHMSS